MQLSINTSIPTCASSDFSLNSCLKVQILWGIRLFFFFSPSKRLKQAVSRPSGLFLSNASADLEKWQKWDASFQSLPTIAAKTFLQIELIASSSQSYTVLLTYLLFLRLSQFRTLKELLLKSFSNLSQYFQTEHCLLAF